MKIDVDALAQEIRRVDGSNSLGAGALAEAIAAFLDTTPANPAQGGREALSDCLDMLARFTHSASNDLNHVEARAVYRAGRAALAAIDTAPEPPGWPDPLESPQAEAIRNGKLDDTEIRNLFDCMERELRLHRGRAVNPAQVTDAMVAGFRSELSMQGYGDGDIRRALTAAIGAAPKNDASAAIAEMRQTAKELRENAIGDCNAARQAIYWEGKADALEAAIGAGGQEVACQWRKRDRVMKHEENWSYVDYHTGLKIAEHPEKYEVRPLYTHPAPSGQAVAEVDDIAARLWKADAEDSGTPASVAKGRTREAFDDQSEGLKNRWRKFANAALSNPPAQRGVVELPFDEARRICKRLEYDASWDKCGHGYYRLKAALRAAPLPGGAK
jgi:hypothetical protein